MKLLGLSVAFCFASWTVRGDYLIAELGVDDGLAQKILEVLSLKYSKG